MGRRCRYCRCLGGDASYLDNAALKHGCFRKTTDHEHVVMVRGRLCRELKDRSGDARRNGRWSTRMRTRSTHMSRRSHRCACQLLLLMRIVEMDLQVATQVLLELMAILTAALALTLRCRTLCFDHRGVVAVWQNWGIDGFHTRTLQNVEDRVPKGRRIPRG